MQERPYNLTNIIIIFSLILSQTVFASAVVQTKNVYTNTHYKYSVPYSNDWKMLKDDPNANVSIFLCNSNKCTNDTQFIVSARFDSSLTNLDNEYFLKHLDEQNVTRLLHNMIDRIGELKEMYFIRIEKVGNLTGYRAKALVRFHLGGVTKILYYALTFNHGYFYNLQYFVADKDFDKDFELGKSFFDDFKIDTKTE